MEHAESVLEEFRSMAADAVQVGHGGAAYAKRMLTNAFGPEGSKKHLDRLPEASGKDSNSQQLQRLEPQLLGRRATCMTPDPEWMSITVWPESSVWPWSEPTIPAS